MTIDEHACNVFVIIGLLATSGLIGFVGWHIIAAIQRFRSGRAQRTSIRTRVLVQTKPAASSDPYGDVPLGI